ncbi:peptidase [Streptomyces albospinus]|uniref:Peptidase n=1 Tax=Streptomyces albospinus TaxID=285515 RepID=A0ABQ2UR84_9ACTN|nr:oxygenase MpaB family protein [Streptomyces albospinus]GGU50001.1 peptidase [Streptomyces albospinus]
MRRYDWLKEIRRLDPEKDFLRIYRITATYEFPWDVTRALELALYRTYAVPSIGRLLAETAELTDRTQKRYDDTALLLDAVLEHGFDGDEGRTALRRINQMHRSYDISNEDMRYVLCTFVVVPIRWIDQYGWRRLSEHEKRAIAAYYRTLGRHMGITEVPQSYHDFERCLDAYEKAHFGWDPGARRVSDATLDLMAGWYGPLAPVVRGASMALLDDALLDAFRYDRPRPAVQKAVRTALKLRARAVRLLPPRRTPHYARQNPEIKGYPNGFRVAELGTFPASRRGGSCPVPHEEDPAAS